jgi:hypothetical protein
MKNLINQKKALPLHSHLEKCAFLKEGRSAAIAQLVERDLAKVEVAGPSPVCRSIF